MKATGQILALIGWAVLIHGTSYAFSTRTASQEQSSEGPAKPSGGDRTADAALVNDGKRQKDKTSSEERRARRHIPDKNHAHSRASVASTNRAKQVQNSPERSTSENVMNVDHPSSRSSAVGAPKIGSNPNPPVRTADVAAHSGQQVKNPGTRGAAPAIIGGPASATRNPAAINGTAINRRHMH